MKLRKYTPILMTAALLLLFALPATAMASDFECSNSLKACKLEDSAKQICQNFKAAAESSFMACQQLYDQYAAKTSASDADCLQGLKETLLSCPGTAMQ